MLQTLPGTGPLAAAALPAEVGDDMEAFGTARRLASWAGICPGNHESAGKSKGGKRRKGNVYLRRILCEIAHAAARTHGVQFGRYKQQLAKRRGAGRAVVATAHKIRSGSRTCRHWPRSARGSTCDTDESDTLARCRPPRNRWCGSGRSTMHRSTADFIAVARTQSRSDAAPLPADLRTLRQVLPDAVHVLRRQRTVPASGMARKTVREMHEVRRGGAGRPVPLPAVRRLPRRGWGRLARQVRREGTVPTVSGAGRGRQDVLQEVSGRPRCGSAETAGEGEISRPQRSPLASR